MSFCALDIETVPRRDLPQACIPQFNPDTVKLGNVKDEAKREIKIEEARQDFEQGLVKKMSLDPDLCQVVCVGIDDLVEIKNSESVLIQESWDLIENAYLAHHPLITFNGLSFDLPVLWHSAIRLGIPVDPRMYADLTKRYENRFHYDLLPILCDWDKQKYKGRGLEFWATLYDIGAKMGDGADIYEWWQAKKYEKIRQHCENDVNITVKLWEKIGPYIMKGEEAT